MQSNYFVQERQIKIVHGPGREPASGQIFLRFEGPEGYVFSYSHGLNDIEPDHRPRQFSARSLLALRMGQRMRWMFPNCSRRTAR